MFMHSYMYVSVYDDGSDTVSAGRRRHHPVPSLRRRSPAPQAFAPAPTAGVAVSGRAAHAFARAPVARVVAMGRAAKTCAYPARIGHAPSAPVGVGQKPSVIGHGVSKPRSVVRDMSRPLTRGGGASRPVRGVSSPPAVGRGVARLVGIPPAPARPELSAREAAGLSDAMRADPSLYACDVSQSKARMPTTTDGTLPTLTPNGKVFVVPLGRCVSGVEKLLLHGFPIHSCEPCRRTHCSRKR